MSQKIVPSTEGKEQHTPGPWHIDRDPRPNMEWNNHIYGADGLAVCFMSHRDGKDDVRDEANARLIAAAPELLEALEYFVSWHTPGELPEGLRGGQFEKRFEYAKAAIKKARGQ